MQVCSMHLLLFQGDEKINATSRLDLKKSLQDRMHLLYAHMHVHLCVCKNVCVYEYMVVCEYLHCTFFTNAMSCAIFFFIFLTIFCMQLCTRECVSVCVYVCIIKCIYIIHIHMHKRTFVQAEGVQCQCQCLHVYKHVWMCMLYVHRLIKYFLFSGSNYILPIVFLNLHKNIPYVCMYVCKHTHIHIRG